MFDHLQKRTTAKNSDKVLTRLIIILQKLSNSEYPTRKNLMEEFNVGAKTIQRDINERLCYFPIEENTLKQLHFIEGFSLNKASLKNDEMLFVYLALSQIKDINKNFDKITHSIFAKLLTPTYSTAYHIQPYAFEDIEFDSKLLNDIERAIEYKNTISLILPNREFFMEPYKVVSFDGIWYLFGKDLDDEKIKTVFIHKIQRMNIEKKKFQLHKPIESILDNVHSAWFDDGNSMEVVIKVYPNAAFNFQLKKILPSQKILQNNEDGSLLVSFEVTTEEDIDNTIKAWIPDVELISPKKYRTKFTTELKKYLQMYEV
ncbi:MAG: WYL domain-containing protein [Campylobacterota bacterium]|nr:WYL domain-containing protein [Campylobacterota bacterium]